MMLTLIGDLHGDVARHLAIMRAHSPTLQVGDCGFSYDYLAHWDDKLHKVLGGNHDNYDELVDIPHYLGDFGQWNGVFYVRGAWSIDHAMRVQGVDWWEAEELSYTRLNEAVDAYLALKPDVVVTHEGPPLATAELPSLFPGPRHRSRTSEALAYMLEEHTPKSWYFGHWHVGKRISIPTCPTSFRSLAIGEALTIEV